MHVRTGDWSFFIYTDLWSEHPLDDTFPNLPTPHLKHPLEIFVAFFINTLPSLTTKSEGLNFIINYKGFDNYSHVKFLFIGYLRNRVAHTPIFICCRIFITLREELCSIHISDYDWPVSFDCFSVLVINIRIDKIYLIVLVNILASSFWYNTSRTLFVNVQLAWNTKRDAYSMEIVKR